MTSIENKRRIKALMEKKISLHEDYKKCKDSGDRVGMQRYKNMINEVDKQIIIMRRDK